jgi:16S rRNA (guanine966-N2)-methyltransferase
VVAAILRVLMKPSRSKSSHHAPRPPARNAPARNAPATGRVRIIGGQWRSRVIVFHDLPDASLRPTPDRVRETLFNWLGQNLAGKRCLDLFSGSGALGFEAASRGAEHVTMVESHRVAAADIAENRAKLAADTCHLAKADVNAFLRDDVATYDIIFVDPPFASGVMPGLLLTLVPRLAEGGVIYAEWGASLAPPPPLGVLKSGKAGASHFALLSVETAA